MENSPTRETKPKLFRTIRWRLVASYALLTFLSVSIVGVLATEIMQRYIREQEIRELKANAESLARQLQPLMKQKTLITQIHSLTQAASFLGDVRVRVIDEDGSILADSGLPGTLEDLLLVYPLEEAARNPFLNQSLFNLVKPDWENYQSFYGFDPGIIEDQFPDFSFQYVQRETGPWGGRITFQVPQVEIHAGSSTGERDAVRSQNLVKAPIGSILNPVGYVELSAGQDLSTATLATLRRSFLLAGGGALLAAVALGLWMSQRLTSPLRELQETAVRMGSGDFSARADYPRSDEIGDLAAQFNLMADQLQENFSQLQSERDTLRRFISDASHELRTPVTALKNFITLLQGPATQDETAQAEFLTESQAQIEQLEWITSNLLDLTRLDAGLEDIDFDFHDVEALMKEVAASFMPRAAAKKIDLELEFPDPPINLLCDALRLKLALNNILDNAIKFTGEGGKIVLGAGQTPNAHQLWVRDTGIGISPQELPLIFDRFYRGRQPAKPGSGLGLAIAKSLVEAQKGQITVESSPGEGSKFRIEFPKIT